LRDDTTPAEIQALDARYGIDLEPNSPESQSSKLMRATWLITKNSASLLDALRQDPHVEAAEPEVIFSVPERDADLKPELDTQKLIPATNSTGALGFLHRRFVPNDPRYGDQWNFKMVGAEPAWKRTRGKGIVVAVIDTGVAGTDSPRGKQARDFGQTNLVPGYDFIHHDEDPYDDNGHGTHVAGTIAESTNNKEGVAGLAFEASIMPLKVLTAEGWGSSSDIADAIRYAADHGANVINMSLGSYSPSEVIHVACRYAAKRGVVIVCAAGNGFGEGVGFPAAYPECIAVSSVGPNSNLAFYSSYGREVTLAAPGGDMMSVGEAGGILQNTVLSFDEGNPNDDYYFFQGTSMASPHVAATAALLMAQGIHDRARVRDILARSAMPKAPRLEYGAGILSADRATALAITQAHRYLLKSLLFLLLAGGLLLLLPGRPLPVRLVFLAALWIGCFAPDQIAVDVGADSPWNLIGFSALIPFMLFWEWEHGVGSQIVATLAAGFACCLSYALLMGLSPFTITTFGHTALLWTLTNIAACVLLAGAAWERGKVKEV
ncbi:MAG: peptidase S8, partial [Abitibacteriaceae bacterium]|nr:peptidase S8 [Abditibacteriaceae bacterium]